MPKEGGDGAGSAYWATLKRQMQGTDSQATYPAIKGFVTLSSMGAAGSASQGEKGFVTLSSMGVAGSASQGINGAELSVGDATGDGSSHPVRREGSERTVRPRANRETAERQDASSSDHEGVVDTDLHTATSGESQARHGEAEHRVVQFGKIYDHLGNHQTVDIGVAGLSKTTIEIDEENLDLQRVTKENLQKGWERDKDWFTQKHVELGDDIDPYEAYKYYQIQRKIFEVLGPPREEEYAVAREEKLQQFGNRVKLSDMIGDAMCSEYAILSAYIAQKIEEPVHLVVGSAVLESDSDQWRGSHMYVWHGGLNRIFDSVLAQSNKDFPALMRPVTPSTQETLESGYDIRAVLPGTTETRFYGLEAGGFGIREKAT